MTSHLTHIELPVALDRAATTLRARLAADPTAPAILVLPAMGVAASYYDRLLDALAACGVTAACADLRGIGASTVRASRATDFGYDVLVSDAAAAALALRAAAPRARALHLLGHSLGGHVALLLLARRALADAPDGVALVACGSPYHRAFGRGARGVLTFAHVARATAEVVGHFPGRRFGFGGREARTLIREWSRLVRRGAFELDAWSGAEPPEAALARVDARLLAIGVDGDSFAPPASLDALVAMVPRAHVERVVVRAGAGGRAAHHRWARRPDDVAARVAAWLGGSAARLRTHVLRR